MGTLGLYNFYSSPEGSTKIGRLIDIGHSYNNNNNNDRLTAFDPGQPG